MGNESMMALSEVLNEKFDELVGNCMRSGAIDLNLYQEYDVKRGLRDSNGKGVLTGLTEISDVKWLSCCKWCKRTCRWTVILSGI